jgi:hypothetical protein
VDTSRLHLALRETRRHFSDPRVLGGMAIIALILGFSGPFGTYATLPTVPRLLYWAAIVLATYGAGFAFGELLGQLLWQKLPNAAARVLAVGALTGLPVTLAVLLVNLLTFGQAGFSVIDVTTLWLNCTLISMGVIAISIIVTRAIKPAAIVSPDQPPALLDRIPLLQRGPLIAISVADHYVEIFTAKGKSLVLLRLSDAIREAAPTPGLRIHRSHWVALDAVSKTLRVDGKLFVELKDGQRLPISRSYLDDVRGAGLMV